MTTREHLLVLSQMEHDRLSENDVTFRRFLLNLASYEVPDRIEILRNHIRSADLSPEAKKPLQDRTALELIALHPGFSPRLVEQVILFAKDRGFDDAELKTQLLRSFNAPAELWEHVVNYQLSEAARALLLVLATISMRIEVQDLRNAHAAYLGRELSDIEFDDALRVLMGTAIDIELLERARVVRITNGSIIDFMWHDLDAHPRRVLRLLQTAVFAEQCDIIARLAYTETTQGEIVYAGIRDAVTSEPEIFIGALMRTLRAPQPLTIVPGFSVGDKMLTRLSFFYPEDRVSLLIDVASANNVPLDEAVVTSAVLGCARDWQEPYGPMIRSSAVGLLQRIIDRPALVTATPVVEGVRRLFEAELVECYDYSDFFWVRRALPDILSTEDEERAVSSLRVYLRELLALRNDEDIGETVFAELKEITEIVKFYNVDLRLISRREIRRQEKLLRAIFPDAPTRTQAGSGEA